ncbi:methyltransferase family protein [Thiogranum longum]|uniref:Methyltransferase family protein n=1 Tax=Thiogranum longum TaxID=1537524 RepID=A0A4R1HLL8_9GAMM|nr:class I SAM-dependent methyltransferase [Thiogranum longum]TCK18102.1 methyltransferase family protein [Thiogranum longum]
MRLGILKEKLVRNFCLKTWKLWEYLGVHLVPNHFYWPIGDTRKLEEFDFDKKFPMDGVNIDLELSREIVERIGSYRDEYEPIHVNCGYASNGDGSILYGMIRDLKPRKVIEVGSGYSTTIIEHAMKKNNCGKIVSIEPYPKPVLRDIVSTSANVELIESKVENVDQKIFQDLGEGDVLFIDSSHVVDIGNDVHYLYLHLLPKIPVGTIIHIHDIRYPYEYPREWVLGAKKFWAEQYLLHMFLAFNDSFEVLFASNYYFQNHKEDLVSACVGLDINSDGWPGSFWLRRCK